MKKASLHSMRKEYTAPPLSKKDLLSKPIQQFQLWFDEAVKNDVAEPNAFTLSTVDSDGLPSSRIVLLKDIQKNGIVFFTNYNSKKGQDIASNADVAVNFFWQPLFRQVRMQGACKKLSETESATYFQSRPLESRIGAITSPQSKVIPNRAWLEKQWEENRKQFDDNPSKPDNWGGYLIELNKVEFWQGRPNRLHDRFLYTKQQEHWTIERLAP